MQPVKTGEGAAALAARAFIQGQNEALSLAHATSSSVCCQVNLDPVGHSRLTPD